jgi:hypothetical protein
MSLPTFPQSPLWAGLDRQKMWNETVNVYDSGDMQGSSPWSRPMYVYTQAVSAYQAITQSSLWAFWDTVQGTTQPFLIMDPYDHNVNSVMGVRSGIVSGTSLQLFDTRSYPIRVDTTTIGSMFSSLSGYIRNGVEYSYQQDTNVLMVNTKAATDVWGVRSAYYFKKVRFTSQMIENSDLWNSFHTALTFREMP